MQRTLRAKFPEQKEGDEMEVCVERQKQHPDCCGKGGWTGGLPMNKRASDIEIQVGPGWDIITPFGAHPEAVGDSGETTEVVGST